MNAVGFAEFVQGEMIAGAVVATVDGKKQYIYRDGEFTPYGRALYNQWQDTLAVPQPAPKYKKRAYAPKE